MTQITITLNGETVSADVEPRTSLADFIRDDQRLTGTLRNSTEYLALNQ